LKQPKKYHFIGIGGIGMSALARIALAKGYQVSGSDITENTATKNLKMLGALIYHEHSAAHIHEDMVVVYSSGIDCNNPEKKQAQALQLPLLHRSELLDQFMQKQKPLLVTGCHGKTSTTAMLSTLLAQGGLDPSFVIGGYLKTYLTNAHLGKGDYFVAEADESDGSFIRSKGFGGIITNTDEDHMEYWKTKERLLRGYEQFMQQTERKELLFLCAEDPFLASCKGLGQLYGFSSECDLRITQVEQKGFWSCFSLAFEGAYYKDLRVKMQGMHQVLNLSAAIGVALKLGVSIEKIRETLAIYEGVKRRLEPIGEAHQIEIFDDYAHHPTEIVTTLQGLKKALPARRLIALFQPHRYTRLEKHFAEFAQAFSMADVCIVTPVYSAGEKPITHISSEALVARMQHPHVAFVQTSHLSDLLLPLLKPNDVVVTLGAGDITYYGPKLLQCLQERYAFT